MRIVNLLIVPLAVGTSAHAYAQERAVTPRADSAAVRVEFAAAAYLQSTRSSNARVGDELLDPRIRTPHGWSVERSYAPALAAKIKARVAKLEEFVHCPSRNLHWVQCQMPAARSVFALGPARISQESARITIYRWQAAKSRSVVYSETDYDLKLEHGEWTVVDAFERVFH